MHVTRVNLSVTALLLLLACTIAAGLPATACGAAPAADRGKGRRAERSLAAAQTAQRQLLVAIAKADQWTLRQSSGTPPQQLALPPPKPTPKLVRKPPRKPRPPPRPPLRPPKPPRPPRKPPRPPPKPPKPPPRPPRPLRKPHRRRLPPKQPPPLPGGTDTAPKSTPAPVSGESSRTTPLSDWVYGGMATFYGDEYDTVDGSCGYGLLNRTQWPYWNAVALSPLNRFRIAGPQQACGQCFEVQCVSTPPYQDKCGPNAGTASAVVTVTDTCPECDADHVDLQAAAFAQLAPPVSGIISIRYRRVSCAPPGGIRVVVTAYNGPGLYLRLTFQNLAGPAAIQSVRVRSSASARRRLLAGAAAGGGNAGSAFGGSVAYLSYGAAWAVNSAPALPLDLFLSTDRGQVTLLGVISSLAIGAQAASFQSTQQAPS